MSGSATTTPPPATLGPGDRVVVVGAGMAGHAAVERLRQDGFTGRVEIVGEEPHRPYNRTPLSKQLLTGDLTPADLALPTFTDLDATYHLGVAATALDTGTQVLTLADGRRLDYDGLILTPGVSARTLPDAPLHTSRVHTLRTMEDAVAVEKSLSGATDRVAVVGGGFIGCEVASTARHRGLDVTIVDLSPTLLLHGLGPELGAVVADLHTAHGVRLHMGVGVATWETHEKGVRLRLTDGDVIDADMAVVGVGTDPHLGWLTGSGLQHDEHRAQGASAGIAASATCHALDSDGRPLDMVVVAGDAARWPNLRFDTTPRRVEHWINAIEMGQAAATNLLTGPDMATPFTPTPRFWSSQHGMKIQSVGMPGLGDTMSVIAGTLTSRRFLASYTRTTPHGPQLMGLIAFDHTQALLEAAPLIGRTVTTGNQHQVPA